MKTPFLVHHCYFFSFLIYFQPPPPPFPIISQPWSLTSFYVYSILLQLGKVGIVACLKESICKVKFSKENIPRAEYTICSHTIPIGKSGQLQSLKEYCDYL